MILWGLWRFFEKVLLAFDIAFAGKKYQPHQEVPEVIRGLTGPYLTTSDFSEVWTSPSKNFHTVRKYDQSKDFLILIASSCRFRVASHVPSGRGTSAPAGAPTSPQHRTYRLLVLDHFDPQARSPSTDDLSKRIAAASSTNDLGQHKPPKRSNPQNQSSPGNGPRIVSSS